MHPGWIFDIVASLVGLSFLALGLAAVGQALRDALDRAFGVQMKHQFPAEDVFSKNMRIALQQRNPLDDLMRGRGARGAGQSPPEDVP